MKRILLVEDDELIGTMVQLNLGHEGYDVTWLKRGDVVAEVTQNHDFDAILLDIDLPGRRGVDVARDLRAAGLGTPIIMLTALDATASKVAALDAGADDYVCKPFDMAELFARVRAQIRRGQAAIDPGSTTNLTIGDAAVDRHAKTLTTKRGEIVTLSDKELAFLLLLARWPARVLTRADILDEVWGMEATPSERTVDNFIVRLRRWVEPDPDAPTHIHTVRGSGYRYDP